MVMTDDEIMRRAELIRDFGWNDSGFWAWSTGEQLIVALVIDAVIEIRPRCGWGLGGSLVRDRPLSVLRTFGWTYHEAVVRCADEKFGSGSECFLLCLFWIMSMAQRLREIRSSRDMPETRRRSGGVAS